MALYRWGCVAVVMCLASGSALSSPPVEVLRADDGSSLAFDDNAPGGEHAMRVFDPQGKLVRELDLADFLPTAMERA